MIGYIITTHAHLDGVALSRPGWWGNIRYPDADQAAKAAATDAGGKPHSITAQSVGRSNR